MSERPAHLQQVVSIRSQRTEQVIDFLRRVANHGLEANVRFLPESVRPEDIAEFCLPVRVVDEQSFNRAMKEGKSDLQYTGEQDRDYVMSSHEELLRSGRHERVAIRQLEQVLGGDRAVVLRGWPGEGKTTALWLHVADVCREFAGRVERWETGIDDPSFRVPLALPLQQLPGPKQREGKTLADVCRQYLLGCCYEAGKAPPLVGRWLDDKIAGRKFSICLDALDELPSHDSAPPRNGAPVESPRDWLRQRLAHNRESPVLLTTRFDAKDEDLLTGPVRYRMVCFGQRQVRDFIERYFRHEASGPQLAAELTKRLRESPGPRHLAQLPLLLSILCQLKQKYPRDPLPATRTKLLRRCLLAMLERGAEKRPSGNVGRPARDAEKLKVLFHVAGHFYGDGPLPLEEGKLVELLKSLPLRKSCLGSADDLLMEFKQDGILVPVGDKRYSFILRSFHEFCQAGSIAASDPAAARREHAPRVYLVDRVKRGWKVLAPGWRHVWPLIAGENPAHAEWLLDAIWPAREESSHRDHIIAVAEVIHEAMEGTEIPPPGAVEFLARLTVAPSSHRVVIGDVLRSLWSSEETRGICAWILGQIGCEALRHVRAADLQREQTARTRREFAWLLEQVGGEAALPVLADDLRQERTPEVTRMLCAEGLGQIGGEASLSVLAAVLQQEWTSERVRRACAFALGQIGGEASRRVLTAVLQQERTPERVRRACAFALGRIGGEA